MPIDNRSISDDRSVFFLFLKVYRGGKQAFDELSFWERSARLFWLLGPFILLIERSPADAWLTILAILFLARSLFKLDFSWIKTFWVQACFIFLLVCLVSSVFSAMPFYAMAETLAWFRFPLFAMATVFWLGKDKRLLYLMLLSTGCGMLLMTGILTAEMFIEGQKDGRLEWPYGDQVPGNYLAKACLPAMVVMLALVVGGKPKIASTMGFLSLVTIVLSILAGERINFLIRACSGMLAGLVWQPNWRRFAVLVLLELMAVITIFVVSPTMHQRYTSIVIRDVTFDRQSDYYKVMGAGISVFSSSDPLLGLGPATYRELCPSIIDKESDFRCDNHPHNFYIQLLTETGVIGLLAGVIMIFSIIWKASRGWFDNRKNVVAATAFVIPFGLFFPIASMGDFFGQWNNIFLWSAVSLALTASHSASKSCCETF